MKYRTPLKELKLINLDKYSNKVIVSQKDEINWNVYQDLNVINIVNNDDYHPHGNNDGDDENDTIVDENVNSLKKDTGKDSNKANKDDNVDDDITPKMKSKSNGKRLLEMEDEIYSPISNLYNKRRRKFYN